MFFVVGLENQSGLDVLAVTIFINLKISSSVKNERV